MDMEEINCKVIKDIQDRRSNAILKAESNKIKALENDEFMQIENRIGALTIDIGKAKYYKQDNLNQLENNLAELKKERIEILSKLNYKEEDLKPNFVCKLCEDKGIYGNKYCSCYNELFSYYNNKNNHCDIDGVTFEDCPNIDKKILNIAKKAVEEYPTHKSYLNISLIGNVGTGKSTLTKAMANAFIKKSAFTIFTSAKNLNDSFLEYHKCFNENKTFYLTQFLECDVLIIDDLGTEPMLNNVTKEYLLMTLSERTACKKMTIISTNLTPPELVARYGERLFSRLFNKQLSITINFDGKDLRLNRP